MPRYTVPTGLSRYMSAAKLKAFLEETFPDDKNEIKIQNERDIIVYTAPRALNEVIMVQPILALARLTSHRQSSIRFRSCHTFELRPSVGSALLLDVMAEAESSQAYMLSQCHRSVLDEKTYLPRHVIAEVASPARARHVLKEAVWLDIDHLDTLVGSLSSRQVIFCITLSIDGAKSFRAFVTEDISDRHLPATKSAQWEFAWNRLALGEQYRHHFLQEQWKFLAPVFDDPGGLLQLHADVPLPFQPGHGAERATRHSVVTQIQIPTTHLPIFQPMKSAMAYTLAAAGDNATVVAARVNAPLTALKHFKASQVHRFRVEHANLVSVLGDHSGAIVQLLGAFSKPDMSGILFPWAECNLKELLHDQNCTIGTNRSSRHRWLLRQMAGLASGLSFIHSPDHGVGSTRRRGRHGDLHTENLLVMRQTDRSDINLQIASFGMAQFQPVDHQFGVAPPTGMYQAPEQFLALPADSSIDIFSLGCLFLEMIIWAEGGPDDFHRFAQGRVSVDPLSDNTIWDDFFLSAVIGEQTVIGVELRPAVVSWLRQCAARGGKDHTETRLLDLIENSMLRINSADRIRSSELVKRVQQIQESGLQG